MRIKKLKPDASKEEVIKHLNYLIEKMSAAEKHIDDLLSGYVPTVEPYDDNTLGEYDNDDEQEEE